MLYPLISVIAQPPLIKSFHDFIKRPAASGTSIATVNFRKALYHLLFTVSTQHKEIVNGNYRIPSDYLNRAFTALACMGRPSASASVTTTSFRLDRPFLLKY